MAEISSRVSSSVPSPLNLEFLAENLALNVALVPTNHATDQCGEQPSRTNAVGNTGHGPSRCDPSTSPVCRKNFPTTHRQFILELYITR